MYNFFQQLMQHRGRWSATLLVIQCHFQEALKSLGRQRALSCPPTPPLITVQKDSVQKESLSNSRCCSLQASQLTALHIVFASELPKLLALVKFYCVLKSHYAPWNCLLADILTVQPLVCNKVFPLLLMAHFSVWISFLSQDKIGKKRTGQVF